MPYRNDVAAGKLAAMDFDFVTAALSRHLLVLDQEILMPGRSVEMGWTDDDPETQGLAEQALEASASHELSGYTLVARRGESWDALLSVLVNLEHDHHALFASLTKRCCQISTEYIVDNGGLYEVLTAAEQIMDDIAGAREERRDAEGHVTPSQAAAFLKLARSRRPDGPAVPDPVTASYFRNLEQRARARVDRRPRTSAAASKRARSASSMVVTSTGPRASSTFSKVTISSSSRRSCAWLQAASCSTGSRPSPASSSTPPGATPWHATRQSVREAKRLALPPQPL